MCFCVGLLSVFSSFSNGSLVCFDGTGVKKPVNSDDRMHVERSPDNWYVHNATHGTRHRVDAHKVDKRIRNISPDKLACAMKSGRVYMALNQCEDGSYRIEHRTRLNGGGPWTAYILYGATKGAAYGTMATGAAAGATALAGPAGAGVVATAANAAGATAGSVGGAAGAGAGAAAGTALGGAAAAEATGAAVVASGGCLATLTAGVEAAAWGVAAVGMWLPTP